MNHLLYIIYKYYNIIINIIINIFILLLSLWILYIFIMTSLNILKKHKCDNYDTPLYVWKMITDYLNLDKSTIIYDPFINTGKSKEYLNLFSSITEAAIIVSTNLPCNILPVVALNQHTSYIAL